jgi:predicted permease
MFRKLKLRLRALFRRDEIGDETALHLEQLTAEFIAHGLTPADARAAARRQFGNVTGIQEQSRRLFSFGLVEDLFHDLRYGWRGLRRTPSVAIAAVLSMGLAIGVNTVVFSLIQELFFSKPSMRAAGDLVTIGLGGSSHASLGNLRDLDASGSFDKVAGFDIETAVNWRRGDEVRQTPVMLVSENYFELLETHPAVGRVFGSREARAELNPHLVLITHRLWTRAFAQDPTVVGRALIINGRPYAVLGVLPERFRPPTFLNTLPDLYVPASPELKPSLLMRQSHALMLVARRKPGQTVAQAHAALRVVAGRMAHDYPRENAGLARSVRLRPIGTLDPDEAPLIAFAALVTVAVFVVLWIACVNVAGVLIARAAARRREIAIRLAIGAGRGRLVRQLLAEALLLASLGTIGGLGLHWYLTKLLNEMTLPLPVPIVFQIEPGLGLVFYAIALTVVAAILSGLVPALQATRPGLSSALKLEDPQYGHRRLTLRNGLLVAQVAVTTVLLSLALLFTRSLARTHSMNPGFDLEHTVWAKVNVLNDRYPKDQVFRFASRALDAATAVPGIRSAALAEIVPFNNFMKIGTAIQTEASSIKAEYYGNSVSPLYFETLGIPILAGRPFAAGDRKGSPHVVILNLALSRRLFGDRSAVGERIWFGDRKEGPGVEVIGVAANSKHLTMGENQANAVYEPIARTQPAKSEINVLVRAATGAGSVIVGLRESLSSLDDTAAVEVGALRTKLAFAYLPTQIGAVFVGSLGALALVLALIGIYGTMAFAVSRRTAEIGVRMALGASTGQVLKAILGASLGTVCIGLAIGIVLAVAAAHPLAFFLAEGITPLDPVTFGSVILICLLAGGIAAIIPARRALSIDPISALRVD